MSVDLRWLQEHAGKRTTPYPGEGLPAPDPTCLGCGAPLDGERGRDGLPKLYCELACARRHQSRLQFAAAEAARHERRLGLKVHSD